MNLGVTRSSQVVTKHVLRRHNIASATVATTLVQPTAGCQQNHRFLSSKAATNVTGYVLYEKYKFIERIRSTSFKQGNKEISFTYSEND